MKIAFLADLHLNTGTYGGTDKDGLSFRMRDFMDAFSWSVSKIINDIKPDAVGILGDIYEHPHPQNNVRRFFNSQISLLSKAGISVHILVGNHDACKVNHALEPIVGMNLPNVHIYYAPTVVSLTDGPVLFVYPHSEKVERQEIGMRDYFLETVKEWKPQVKKLKDRHSIFLGHFPIRGAFVSDSQTNDKDESICCDDIDLLSPSYGLLGDFHATQKLGCKTEAMYVGSLERGNFNDIKSKKGFVVYDSNGVDSPVIGKHISFVEYPTPRPMRQIEGDWDYIQGQLGEVNSNAKNAIIKINFYGSRSQYLLFDKEKDGIKKTLIASGAKLVLISSQINDPERTEAAKKIQEEIKKMDDVEFGDIDQVVDTALKINSKTPDEAKTITDLAHDIMKAVRVSRASATGSIASGTVRIHGIKGHNFQRFGEKDNIIEFDKGAKYFLGMGLEEIPQWQKEDFHRKGKAFLDQCLKDPRKKILSIVGMTDGDGTKSNGTGKSTVIEMVSYAFYEKRTREFIHKFGDREKGKSTTSIMREKDGVIACKEAFVDALFSVDNSLWLLRRGRRLTGSKHDSIFELHCITSDGFTYSEGSHAGHRGEDASLVLSELVRMPFETFCNSLLFGQNDAGQFLVGTDKTRKEIIINILQLAILNDYLEETRKRKRLAESEISAIKAQIEVLSEGADAKEKTLLATLETLSSELLELEKQLLEVKNKISKTTTTDAVSSYERAKADYDSKKRTIEIKSQEMEKEISNLNTLLEKAKKDRNEKDKATEQIQKRIDEDKTRLSTLEKNIAEYPDESYKSQMSLIASAKKAKPERVAQQLKIQNSLNDLLPTHGELLGAIKDRETELVDLQNLKSNCNKGHQVQCSKCRQLVGLGHIEAEIARVTSEITVKKSKEAEILKEKEALVKENKEVKGKLENIEKYVNKEAELVRSHQENESAKLKVEETKTRIENYKQEIEEATERFVEASTEHNKLVDKITNLSNDKEKAIAPYVQDKEKAEQQLEKAKVEVDRVKKEVKQLEEESKTISTNIDSKKTAKTKAEVGIENIKTSKEKAKELSTKLDNQLMAIEYLKTLDWVFGPDGAQVSIIEKYMPLLNHHFQEFLDIVSDGTIRASVVTDGKKEGKVELVVSGELSSVTDGLSGGESVKLRLALDMALGMLSLTRANGSLDSIYIDEAIAPVDVDSKDRILELLSKLQEHFRTVIIVSHDSSIQEKIKETIVINKVDGISVVHRQFYEKEPLAV